MHDRPIHHSTKESAIMPKPLSTLFPDFRLYGLFGNDQNLTVSQIWILEIDREGSSELRFLYGRSLPGTFQSDSWSGTGTSKTPLYDHCTVKTHSLTLHTSTEQLKTFLEHFISGASLQAASQLAGLKINDKLAKTVGASTFGENPVARPVMHLPTRDYYQFQSSRLSPTSYASVDSGAISPEGKPKVFTVPEGCDRKIAEAACRALDADTGMDFSKLDAWRIGDFEFICSPGLNAAERSKFDISLKGQQSSLTLFEPLTQEPSDLLIIVKALSDGSTQASYIARLGKDDSYPLHHTFEIKEFQDQVSTAYTLEIYALVGTKEKPFLQLQTGGYFMRSMNLDLQIADPIRTNAQLGWLMKKVPNREKAKLEAAEQIGRTLHSSRSRMGGHTEDQWIPLNRLTEDSVKQLRPKKSDGRFFLTLNDSGGMSRLLLIDWLRSIFEQHRDAQIAWIDPFMEDVGIELLNRLGTATANYLIITTEKESSDDSKRVSGQPNRIEKLLSKCADWDDGYFGNVLLKVLAVPENRLHDRMILIRSANGRSLAGYHLSNSVQRASENFPLLVTPIPLDVMPHVFEYVDQIIQSTLHGDGKISPSAKLIFNSVEKDRSKEVSELATLSQRCSFVDPPRAGDVLAWWLGDAQLAGLTGSELMEQMNASGYSKDGELDPKRFDSLPIKLWSEGLQLADFHSAWDALGYVLASSQAGDLYTKEKSPLPEPFKQALLEHICSSRPGALQPRIKKSQIDIEFYLTKKLTALLLSHSDPFHAFGYSPVDTSWSDYYAIKLLWSRAPKQFVFWLSTICSEPIKQPRTHALVVEALKHICERICFDKNPEQIDALLQSNVNVIVWVGLHALENAINRGNWGGEVLSKIDQIQPASVRRTILCWLINEANYLNSDAKPQLIALLTQSLQAPLTDGELKDLLQPVRGRLGRLHHLTPWILESMLVPMLEQRAIDITQVARQWLTELTTQWRQALKNDSLYFKLEADGAFTDELAVLTKYLSPAVREEIFSELRKVFDTLARTIRQPMSAQISWSTFSNAYKVNIWLYALARRIPALPDDEATSLNGLLLESEALIERINSSTWDSISSDELLTYMKGDPDQIASHSLHHSIQRVVAQD